MCIRAGVAWCACNLAFVARCLGYASMTPHGIVACFVNMNASSDKCIGGISAGPDKDTMHMLLRALVAYPGDNWLLHLCMDRDAVFVKEIGPVGDMPSRLEVINGCIDRVSVRIALLRLWWL